MGRLPSGSHWQLRTRLFWDTRASGCGGVVGLSSNVAFRAVVSQDAEPIGAPWTIAGADGYVPRSIGTRPAYKLLVETLRTLDERQCQWAARNFLVGLAMDEHRPELRRGQPPLPQPDGRSTRHAAPSRSGRTCGWAGRSSSR